MFDFLPVDEGKLVTWFQNFVGKLKGLTGKLGLPDSEVVRSESDANSLSYLVKGIDQARSSAPNTESLRSLEAYKDVIKNGPSESLKREFPSVFTATATRVAPGILPRLHALVRRISANPTFTPAIGEGLGITTAAPIPEGDNELVGWMHRFTERLPLHRTALGLTDAEANSASEDYHVLSHLVNGVDGALNDQRATPGFKELVAYKDLMKYGAPDTLRSAFPTFFASPLAAAPPGIMTRLYALIERIRALPLFNSGIAELLGFLPAVAAPFIHRPDTVRVPPVPIPEVPAVGSRWVVPALLGLLALGLVGWLLWPKETTPVVVAESLPTILAKRQPADALMLFEKGATEWVAPAADEFNRDRTGQGHVLLTSLGSREGRDHILFNKEQVHPTIWMPADTYWVDKLRRDATDPNVNGKSGSTVEEASPLLRTYLVLLMRDDRAKVFEAAMQKEKYKGHTWRLLNDIATQGWSAVGGQADWGKLKLTQSNPLLSNSGMTALSLMFAEFQRDNPTKDINNKGFMQIMQNIEGTVDSFTDTTSDSLKAFTDNPTKYDVAILYEKDAMKAIDDGATGIHVIYPEPTAEITLSTAIVSGSWVTPEQANLGKAFVDYLKKDDVQQRALSLGYRPASEGLVARVTEAFGAAKHRDVGLLAAPGTAGSETDTKAKEGLIFNWDQWHKKAAGG